jgi:D-tyrosyl-tRNA(Tyr) deacylase
MRAVIQRVLRGEVQVDDEIVGRIGPGLCALVGVENGDEERDALRLAEKVANLRIFSDDQDRMNLSLLDTGGGLLAVSQFTLLGDARKGRRPSFVQAMDPKPAAELFQKFCEACEELGVPTATGRFGADMRVELVGHGPVTILLDTRRQF